MSLSLYSYSAPDQLKVTGLAMAVSKALFPISQLLLLLLAALSLPRTQGDKWWNEEVPQLQPGEPELVTRSSLSDKSVQAHSFSPL